MNSITSEVNLGNVNLYPGPLLSQSIRSMNNAMASPRLGMNVPLTVKSHIHPVKAEKGLIEVKHMLVLA